MDQFWYEIGQRILAALWAFRRRMPAVARWAIFLLIPASMVTTAIGGWRSAVMCAWLVVASLVLAWRLELHSDWPWPKVTAAGSVALAQTLLTVLGFVGPVGSAVASTVTAVVLAALSTEADPDGTLRRAAAWFDARTGADLDAVVFGDDGDQPGSRLDVLGGLVVGASGVLFKSNDPAGVAAAAAILAVPTVAVGFRYAELGGNLAAWIATGFHLGVYSPVLGVYAFSRSARRTLHDWPQLVLTMVVLVGNVAMFWADPSVWTFVEVVALVVVLGLIRVAPTGRYRCAIPCLAAALLVAGGSLLIDPTFGATFAVMAFSYGLAAVIVLCHQGPGPSKRRRRGPAPHVVDRGGLNVAVDDRQRVQAGPEPADDRVESR